MFHKLVGLLCVSVILGLVAPARAAEKGTEYADPGGAFALLLPEGYRAQRAELGGVGYMTTIAKPGADDDDEETPKIEVVVIASQEAINPGQLGQTAEALFALVVGAIEEDDGKIKSRKNSKVTFGGTDAVRCDMVFTREEDGELQSGYMVTVLGKKHALLVAVSAPQKAKAEFAKLDAAAATLAVEAAKPLGGLGGAAAKKGGSLLDARTMAKAAEQIRANLKREAVGTVLVEGEPPLTAGSVSSFVNILSIVFDVQLTEAEYELVKQRFVEYYKKQDAAGKKILAQGAQGILDGLNKATPEERAKGVAEIKAVMEDRLANGAKLGIESAAALHEAIQRRKAEVQTVKAEKPAKLKDAEKLDRTLSEADLDASLEMLYFMWVASGRDASHVTPEAVAAVRAAIAANFHTFSPELQYCFANAEKVYAQMRGVYQGADGGTRAQLARAYGQALDELGLTVPQAGGGGGGSAWDDMKGKDESSVRAELMQSYAYSAATSSSFSGRSVSY